MLITTNELPSKGKLNSFKGDINISALTYKELVDYMSTPEYNPLKAYKKDILLLQNKGVDLSTISLVDLDYLIFFQKAVTISEESTFSSNTKCIHCKKSIPYKFHTSEIRFIEYEKSKIPIQIELNNINKKIVVPSVERFLTILNNYIVHNLNIKLDLIKLYSIFLEYSTDPNGIESTINNATSSDSATLFWLENIVFDRVDDLSVSCTNPKCKKLSKTKFNINNLVQNFFQSYIKNNTPDRSKILFE